MKSKIQFLFRKLRKRFSHHSSRINRSARMFIPGVGKKLVVIPFTTLSIIPIAVLVLLCGYLLVRSDVFLVKDISIQLEGGIQGDSMFQNGIADTQEIEVLIQDDVTARSIWSVDKNAVKNKILETYPSVESVTITNSLPDTISVLAVERKPVAQIVIQKKEITPEGRELQTGEYYLIDDFGEIFIKVNRKVNVPEFHYDSITPELLAANSVIGYQFDQAIIKAVVHISEHLAEYKRFDVAALEIKDVTSLAIKTNNDLTVFVGIQDDIESQLRELEIVYEQIVYSGRRASVIDTRFDKTVVQYQ